MKSFEKTKGIKKTCGQTRQLGRYMGDNIQVFYDSEADEVFGMYHTLNEWSVFHDDSIIEVATYHDAVTMDQIRRDLRYARTYLPK